MQPRLDKDVLALKRAKETKRPDVYMGQSQKHLDRYFRQVESTFWLKPTIYASKENKCVYISEYLSKTPAEYWVAMDRATKESDQVYSFEAFRDILQNGLLPKAQQEGKLFACLKVLSQRSTQSVRDFLAHFTTIEQQLDHEMLDWIAHYFIMTRVYLYLQETLRLRDRLGKTRLELEENLKSIKGMAPAPIEISVWETYWVSQRKLALAKAEVQTKRKFVPGRTID